MVLTFLNFAMRGLEPQFLRPEKCNLSEFFYNTTKPVFFLADVKIAAFVLISLLNSSENPNAPKARENSKRSKALAT